MIHNQAMLNKRLLILLLILAATVVAMPAYTYIANRNKLPSLDRMQPGTLPLYSYSLPTQRTKLVKTQNMKDASALSIVVPVKNNQTGINKMLDSFFRNLDKNYKPASIVIVDNNSDTPLVISAEQHAQAKKYHVIIYLLKCNRIGPAAARNTGWRYAHKHGAQWILFVDSDCIFTDKTISGYISAMDGSIAYQGSIAALNNDWLSNWYVKNGILQPASFIDPYDLKHRPSHVTTANALVHINGLLKTNGFSEDFKFAAGEDVWLGNNLLQYGTIAFAPQAVIQHDFLDGNDDVKFKNIYDFIKRFERYGSGVYTRCMLCKTPVSSYIDQPNRFYIKYRNFISISNQDAYFPKKISANDLVKLKDAAMLQGFTRSATNEI